ncbi:hypothetical protein K8S19_10660 [bacterium]|nr:hypothetical protein [bacterium]
MARVKGTALIPRLKYIDEQGTPEQKERILTQLSPVFQADIRKNIYVGMWYPFEYYIEINRAMDKVFGSGDFTMIPQFGKYSAEHSLKGVYKFFYKVGSPDFIIMRATKVWNQYFENGTLTAEKEGTKQVRMILLDVEMYADEHNLSVLGWVKRTLELSGGKNVKSDIVKHRKKGDPHCEIVSSWE